MTNTFNRIKSLIVEQLDIEESKITLESSFANDLNADSLDIVEIIMGLEEQFEIEITDEDAQKILTIKNAVEYINEKIAQKEEL